MTQHIVWDINPEILNLGPFQIRWYGLFFALSIAFAYFILRKIFRDEGRVPRKLEILFYYVVIGTITGARLGHCLFYTPSYYLNNPLEILKFWNGGLASHGGVIGILIALFIFTRKYPEYSFLSLLDKIALVAGLNGFFIRLGNLFNSELIGTPTTLPWAFIFKRIDHIPRHPVQLYESLSYGIIFLVLITLYCRHKEHIRTGFIAGLFFVLVFTTRFLLEFFKTRQAEYSLNLPFSTGQMLSIPFCVVGIGLIFYSCKHENRPG